MTDTETTREYLNEDNTPMVCGDCGQPTYYDYADDAYHHAYRPQHGCGLIRSESRDPDPGHPGLNARQRAAINRTKR